MILYCNYEELRALRHGARAFLGDEVGESCAPVAAPPQARAEVEALVPRLAGDMGIHTLVEQQGVRAGVAFIVECLRAEMEAMVVDTHPAHEGAVAAYFDFAHALSVRDRLDEMGHEMVALIELVTGSPADETTARTFVFPD